MRKDMLNVDSIIRDMGELSPMERAVLVGYLVAERPQGKTVKEQRAAYAGEQRRVRAALKRLKEAAAE